MFDNYEAKGIIGAAVGVFGFLYGCITEILVVLGILMLFDYITGVTVALKEGNFNPAQGVWGAIRKLFYIMIVATGFLADFTISDIATKVDLEINTHGLLGIVVTLYLIGNEGLSLTRNWVILGLPAPPFLRKLFGYIKDQSGKIIKIPKEDGEDT